MLLMGLPFLLLSVSAAIPVVALVIFVFVIGEMLWVPTSQSVVAGLAPEDVRGAYMGAFGSTAAAGFALAPFIGLQVRDSFGDGAMWAMFAGVLGVGGAARCDRVPGRAQPSRQRGPRLVRRGVVAKDRRERERIMRQGVVLPETPRDRRQPRGARAGSARQPARGQAAPAAPAELPADADSYLASLGGPLPYMVAAAGDRGADGRARAGARRGVRAQSAAMPAAWRVARGALGLQRGERPDRAAQPLVSGRVAPADGSADGRLRARQRRALPPRAARRYVGARAVSRRGFTAAVAASVRRQRPLASR